MNKKGVSQIIVTVIMITIVLAAVGVVWVIVQNVLSEGAEDISVASQRITLDVEQVKVTDSGIDVRVHRDAGEGDLAGIKFIVSDGVGTQVFEEETALDELGTKTFSLSYDGFVKSVEVAPVILSSSGKKATGIVVDTLDFNPKSCLELKEKGYDEDGVYWVAPIEGEEPIQVNCDMTRDGGGWTQILKTWYRAPTSSRPFGETGAIGNVTDGLVHLGNGYKLSDENIRAIIGENERFDILADQSGYNTAYSNGNYEYVILRGYTGYWRFDAPVEESRTTTTFQSYRLSDNALAWTGNLRCGYQNSNAPGPMGINCVAVLENNPQGGAGCDINMGKSSKIGWHHFFMGQWNQDTYLYICNGAQHSSGNRFSHRFWVREQ